MQNDAELRWHVQTKNDIIRFKNELRVLLGSNDSGPQVPFSLEMSQSFREFEIKCYQFLSNGNNSESTFHVRLDHGYSITFDNGTVDLKKPTIIARKADDCDLDPDQEQDDI